MTRKLCLLAVLLVALPPVPARAASRVMPGTPLRVHVARPGGGFERFEGRLVSTGDTLVLRIPLDEQEMLDTLRIAVSEISRAEVSEGKKRVGKTGPIVAGVLCAGIGLVAAGYWALTQSENSDLTPESMGAVLVVTPVVCGVLGGWMVARGAAGSAPPAWKEIPPSSLREQ